MRRLLTAASAAASLGLALVAPPAAADGCLAVTGTMTHPTWLFRLSPGLWTDQQPQTVSLSTNGGFSLVVPVGHATFTCVTASGASTSYTGYLRFDTSGASGASLVPEDVVSGAGRVDGIAVTGDGFLGTSVTPSGGTYHLRPRIGATASLSYVRAGTSIALVLVLAGTTFDVDGDGPVPPSAWGDIAVSGGAALDENPFRVSYDLRDHGRITFVSLEPGAGVATG